MGRLVYINGKFVKEEEAYISIFDRGFLFSDAIYEVTAVIDKKLVSWEGHLNRLRYSLSELNIKFTYTDEELFSIHKKLIVQNKIIEGLVYLQISRGKAERDFAFPKPEVEPTIVLFTQIKNLINNPKINFGSKVISSPDLRWGRADIKTVQLLYASIMKQKALDLGKDDVWFENNKLITEPYVSYKCSLSMLNQCGKFENIKVPEDHFLVLGDNRSNSWDGRYWPGSKFLHKKEIIGKAYFRFWPLSQVGFFNK